MSETNINPVDPLDALALQKRLGVFNEAWILTYDLCREGAITEALRHEVGVLLREMGLAAEGKAAREMRSAIKGLTEKPVCDYCHHVHSPTQDHYLG